MATLASASTLSFRHRNGVLGQESVFDAPESFLESPSFLKLNPVLSSDSFSCFAWKTRCLGVGVARAGPTEVAVDERTLKDGEKGQDNGRVLRVGLICGGPSAERGISLNSARSVLDHIQGDDLHVSCYYIDCDLNAYAISSAQNTLLHPWT